MIDLQGARSAPASSMHTITSRSPPGMCGVLICTAVGRWTEVIAADRCRNRGHTDGGWLFAYNYTPRHFARGRAFRGTTSTASPGTARALVMHFSFHEAIVSSAGLARGRD